MNLRRRSKGSSRGGSIRSPRETSRDRLLPPDHDGGSALDHLFPASGFETEIDAAIRPVIGDRQLLLPRPFADALEGACLSMQRLNERHGKSVVLDRATKILLAEQELRNLALMYRNALHQA